MEPDLVETPIDRLASLDKLTLSLDETAAVLSISERHVRQLIADRRLPHVMLGHRKVVPVDELRRYIAALTVPAPSG